MGRLGPEILGRLFDEHAAALVLFARPWCEAPEDVVQDAFVALARQDPAPDRAVAWLYRVVRNGAIAAARRSHRRRRRERRSADRESVPGAPWFDATDDRIDAAHAARLLDGLDAETREIIIARVWGGLTFEEAARLHGCSLTTAHRRYQAGLARLHERLESPWTRTSPTPAPVTKMRSDPT
jgi:RNA polymerase sigma-70 factor (ECF subfamily)